MTRWEYTTLIARDFPYAMADQLNKMGLKGWELYYVANDAGSRENFLYFKRPHPPIPDTEEIE